MRTHRPALPLAALLPLAVALLLACTLPAGPARSQACGEIVQADTSDSWLPYGFNNTIWGMSPAAVEAVRGQTMERQSDLTHAQVHYRFERVQDEVLAQKVWRVRYTFYNDRLLEVRLYLPEDKIEIAESVLVGQFEEQFGRPVDQQTEEIDHTSAANNHRVYPDKTWVWCDRFTTQLLMRRPDNGEVLIRRYSRVLYAELVEEIYGLQDVEMWKKVQGLELL